MNNRSIPLTYALAVLLTGAAVTLSWILERQCGPLPTYVTFYPATIISALIGGAGPGLLATALAGLIVSWVLPPAGSLAIQNLNDAVGLALFCVNGAVISLIAARALKMRTDLEASRRSEERLRSLADNIAQLAWMGDEKGRVIWQNQRWHNYTGISLEKMEGSAWETLLRPDEAVRFARKIDHSLETAEELQDTIPLRGKDGQYSWFLSTVLPIFNKRGDVWRWIGTHTDVTRQFEAEESLRRKSELLSRAQEIAQLGSWELDLVKNRLSWSDEVYRIFGLQPQQFGATYEAFLDSVHPDDRAAVNAAYSGSLREGRDTYEIEHRIIRKSSGEVRVVHERCEHFRDESGRIIRSVGMVHDISERKRAEEAVFYRANITEVASDALYATDTDFNILIWNKSAEYLYGWKTEEVVGKQPYALFHPQFLTGQSREDVFGEVTAKGTWRGEVVNMRKDGSQITVIASINAIKASSGNFIGFAVCHTDITDRKRMETELRRSRDELEIRVRERTAELHESEARLRALASELMNAQETERKRIAHELHDGLAAQLAAVKFRVEDRLKRVENRLKKGESVDNPITLEDTIKDIGTAITETRRIMANLRPSVLDDLGLLPALSWYSREVGETYPGTSVEYSGNLQENDVPEHLKIVLFRVVQESIANAIRHGKSSLIQIALHKDGNWLRLSVSDNGNGFKSVRKSTTGGIGLDSMQQRVESTGGIFSVSSEPGTGTVVKAEWRIN